MAVILEFKMKELGDGFEKTSEFLDLKALYDKYYSMEHKFHINEIRMKQAKNALEQLRQLFMEDGTDAKITFEVKLEWFNCAIIIIEGYAISTLKTDVFGQAITTADGIDIAALTDGKAQITLEFKEIATEIISGKTNK